MLLAMPLLNGDVGECLGKWSDGGLVIQVTEFCVFSANERFFSVLLVVCCHGTLISNSSGEILVNKVCFCCAFMLCG